MICEYEPCVNEFEPTDHKQRFCSDACRNRNHRAIRAAPKPLRLSIERTPDGSYRFIERVDAAEMERMLRWAIIEAKLPSGVRPGKIDAAERTYDMFIEPTSESSRSSPATVSGRTSADHAGKRAKRSADEPPSSSSNRRNAGATQKSGWIRWLVVPGGLAHTLAVVSPNSEHDLTVCGKDISLYLKAEPSDKDCRDCARLRSSTATPGLRYEHFTTSKLFPDISVFVPCTLQDFEPMLTWHPWRSLSCDERGQILEETLRSLIAAGTIAFNANTGIYDYRNASQPTRRNVKR